MKFWIMVWVISVRAEVSAEQRIHRREFAGDGVGFTGLHGDLLGDVAQRERDWDIGGLSGGDLHAGLLAGGKAEGVDVDGVFARSEVAKAVLALGVGGHFLGGAGGFVANGNGRVGQRRAARIEYGAGQAGAGLRVEQRRSDRGEHRKGKCGAKCEAGKTMRMQSHSKIPFSGECGFFDCGEERRTSSSM